MTFLGSKHKDNTLMKLMKLMKTVTLCIHSEKTFNVVKYWFCFIFADKNDNEGVYLIDMILRYEISHTVALPIHLLLGN